MYDLIRPFGKGCIKMAETCYIHSYDYVCSIAARAAKSQSGSDALCLEQDSSTEYSVRGTGYFVLCIVPCTYIMLLGVFKNPDWGDLGINIDLKPY